MNVWCQELYNRAWNFAARAHRGQDVPGQAVPYLAHLGSVAMEVMTALAQTPEPLDGDLALGCALLHDVIEDAGISYARLREEFGQAVADGVQALTKDAGLPTKEARMADSLARLHRQPREVQMVKLADRITNLQPPPFQWSREKIRSYRDEAVGILEAVGGANVILAERLSSKIQDYGRHGQDLVGQGCR